MYCDLSPRLIGFHVVPPSSVRNAPADEIATNIRLGSFGSWMIGCRHKPPPPGCHCGPVPWPRSPESSFQFSPPSVERKRAASSTPAYTVSGSANEGSRCQTRLNSHGRCDPSYHWCVVSGLPGSADASYTNLLLSPFGMPSCAVAGAPGGAPGSCRVLPPSCG